DLAAAPPARPGGIRACARPCGGGLPAVGEPAHAAGTRRRRVRRDVPHHHRALLLEPARRPRRAAVPRQDRLAGDRLLRPRRAGRVRADPERRQHRHAGARPRRAPRRGAAASARARGAPPTHTARAPLRRSLASDYRVGTYRGRGPLVTQEVFLEPIGTEVIFSAPRALRLETRAPEITVDDTGTVTVPSASARLHYRVESELEMPGSPRGGRRAGRLTSGEARGA